MHRTFFQDMSLFFLLIVNTYEQHYSKDMKKIHTSITINAPKEKTWHTMLDLETYKEWTAKMNEGSYYKGDWSKGSKMLFLGPNPEPNQVGGMYSEIVENKPYEFLSIQHLGVVKNGAEDTTSDEAKQWAPAYENYTFQEHDGNTEIVVDSDVPDEYYEMFVKSWADGLNKLKEIAER